jgi:hypothetical protein
VLHGVNKLVMKADLTFSSTSEVRSFVRARLDLP